MVTISETAVLDDLSAAIDLQPRAGVSATSWRWSVRQRLIGIRELLLGQTEPGEDAWGAARRDVAQRDRQALLVRLSTLGPQVLEDEDLEGVRRELARFVRDVRRYVQRGHDLAWDEVEQEFGGSE